MDLKPYKSYKYQHHEMFLFRNKDFLMLEMIDKKEMLAKELHYEVDEYDIVLEDLVESLRSYEHAFDVFSGEGVIINSMIQSDSDYDNINSPTELFDSLKSMARRLHKHEPSFGNNMMNNMRAIPIKVTDLNDIPPLEELIEQVLASPESDSEVMEGVRVSYKNDNGQWMLQFEEVLSNTPRRRIMGFLHKEECVVEFLLCKHSPSRAHSNLT